MARKPFTPFLLASETTGEAHVLVTDENGFASTQSAWNPHASDTNAADGLAGQDAGGRPGNAVDPGWAKAGCWFGTTASGAPTQPDEDAGALPYDRDTLTELSCDGTAAQSPIVGEGITVGRHGGLVNLGTLAGAGASRSHAPAETTDGNGIAIAAMQGSPDAPAFGDEGVGTPGSGGSSATVDAKAASEERKEAGASTGTREGAGGESGGVDSARPPTLRSRPTTQTDARTPATSGRLGRRTLRSAKASGATPLKRPRCSATASPLARPPRPPRPKRRSRTTR